MRTKVFKAKVVCSSGSARQVPSSVRHHVGPTLPSSGRAFGPPLNANVSHQKVVRSRRSAEYHRFSTATNQGAVLKRLNLTILALALTGCAAKMTLIDRTDGRLQYGSTDGSTMGGSGNATLNIDDEAYAGPWIYQPSGGSFGFSNFGATTSITGTASSYSPKAGFANATLSGTGTTTGTATAMAVSAVGNGMINVRAPSGKFMRCVFTFNTLQNTGIGECLRNDGRAYDLTLKR